MNAPSPNNDPKPPTHSELVHADDMDEVRTRLLRVSLVSYALHAITAAGAVIPGLEFTPGILLIAFILDLWFSSEARRGVPWLHSHFEYRLHTVIWAFVLYVITSPLYLLLYIPGKVAWFLISCWFAYRIILGFLALREDRAIGP